MNTNQYLISKASEFNLSNHPSRVNLGLPKSELKAQMKTDARAIRDLAHKLYGEAERSLLIVLQGMDTSGKDSTTSAIFAATPPLNVKVSGFKAPSKREAAQDYLWRIHNACPAAGEITVFNRSHYEDVLVVKVREFASAQAVEQRYAQINDFERHLTENGTTVLKFMLNISYETQGARLMERLVQPGKRWKFNPGDLEDRKLWPQFMDAYETMVQRTSTAHAPWHVIPSDSRSVRKALITAKVRETLEAMKPAYPDPGYRPEDFDIG